MSELAPASPGAPPLRLNVEGPVALFADLHLRAEAPEEIAAFIAELEALPPDCTACVVMGDLFDAYLGGESWRGAFARLAEAFAALRDRGVRVLLLRGNRDALLEAHDLPGGPEVVDGLLLEGPEPSSDGEQGGGAALLLVHGDEYCLGDHRYQFLRRRLRGRILRPLLRGLPHGLRRRLAARMRRVSQGEVARKPLDTLALTMPAVERAAAAHGVRGVVIGHLHVDELRPLGADRRLRILPAWKPGLGPLWTGSILDETV